MTTWLAQGFFSGTGQGTRQVVELVAAFGLTTVIGSTKSMTTPTDVT